MILFGNNIFIPDSVLGKIINFVFQISNA